MKVNVKSIIVAAIALILFTILPLASPKLVAPEFFKAASAIWGIDLVSLLNKVAVIGFIMAALILLNGMAEKSSKTGLILSITSKIFWFIVVLFILGLGKIENFGLAVLSGGSDNVSNIVTVDLRLIALLAAVIVSLKIANLILEFRDRTSIPAQALPKS
ncbi:MAG: hypothetical protein QXJ17_04625 [Nitrososphaeria archaeon]